MIATITGKLTHKSIDYLIIDVGGVGYQLFVPLSTYYKLTEEKSTVSLNTYLNVREDALLLYGFWTMDEKNIFLKLISISGVGPKLALSILSGISTADLINAVQVDDIAKLTTIPGVGKKTAERLALELKDKLKKLELSGAGSGIHVGVSGIYEDVLSALVNLGYKQNAAESALKIVIKEAGGEKTLEKLLKMTLNVLSNK